MLYITINRKLAAVLPVVAILVVLLLWAVSLAHGVPNFVWPSIREANAMPSFVWPQTLFGPQHWIVEPSRQADAQIGPGDTLADLTSQAQSPGFAALMPSSPDSPLPLLWGWRIGLPALDTVNCETWIQTQNVGDDFTKAILVLWGDPGSCEPQAAGPIKAECSGLIPPGGAWTWMGAQLPSGARSAIVYSLGTRPTERGDVAADVICEYVSETVLGDDDDWRSLDSIYSIGGSISWAGGTVTFPDDWGQPLAVTVNRVCPGDNTPGMSVNAGYPGPSSEIMQFAYDSDVGGYVYYAWPVWASFGTAPDDMNSTIHIQNLGDQCTFVELWFQAEDDCGQWTMGEILDLAPGESFPFDPNTVTGLGFQGNAWILASEPLGVLVDHVGRDLFMSHTGMPAVDMEWFGLPIFGAKVNYVPLFFRESQGWDINVHVQNFSSDVDAKVKVYFKDAIGNILSSFVVWLCPEGSKTIQLSASDLQPGYDVGTALIESLDYMDGDTLVEGPNITSVVTLIKYADLARTQPLEALSYNALPIQQVDTDVIGLPVVSRGFVGVTSEIALANLNTSPGTTDVEIFLFDQNGLVDSIDRQLAAGEIQYIDFDALTPVNPGFLGSVVISTTATTQPEVSLAAVGVERVGRVLSDPDFFGDEVMATEGRPLSGPFTPYPLPECPQVPQLMEPPRVSLPALDTVNCESWIQVQNTGDGPSKAILVLWGDPGSCEPQASGPIKAECSGLIMPGGTWTWKGTFLPSGAKSGIVYSLGVRPEGNDVMADIICEQFAETILGDDDDWRRFDLIFRNGGSAGWSGGGYTFPDDWGEPLAVTVNRNCPGDNNPTVSVNAVYPGIDWSMEGACNPEEGGYTYFAPLVYAGFGTPPDDFHSVVHMQNTGEECTSIEIWFQELGQCDTAHIGTILGLAPGEAWQFDPNTVIGPDFQGVARIRATQPLAIVVDHYGRDLFFDQPGMPADVPAVGYSAGSVTNIAPLFYREDQGWDTTVQVQNLSLTDDTAVDVTFMDRTGNVITALTDAICAGQSESFVLPLSDVATGSQAGWVQVDSDGPNVLSTVVMVKYADPTRTQPLEALSYNVLPTSQVDGTGLIAIPMAVEGGQGVLTEIALLNANSSPGTTDVLIDLYDENQVVGSLARTLAAEEVEYIDLYAEAVLPPGVIGSAVVSATGGTQEDFGLAAVGVERIGRTLSDPDIPGDEVKGYTGRAIQWPFGPYPVTECPSATTPVLGLPSPLRINLPAIETIDAETWIQVQNAGGDFTKAMLVLWGDPGPCEPQAAGPIKAECTGLIPPGGAWTWTGFLLPSGAQSGIIYSLGIRPTEEDIAADVICEHVAETVLGDDDDWRRFDRAYSIGGNISWRGGTVTFPDDWGEPLAVTVSRIAPDPDNPSVDVSAAYGGIPPEMMGQPGEGCAFTYYAPRVYADFDGLNSILVLQNAGQECASISVWYRQEGECAAGVAYEVLALAPGESWYADPNLVVGPFFKGSASIVSTQPLAVVLDNVGGGSWDSAVALPADAPDFGFSAGDTANYGPLFYRETHGWDTVVRVQNLSTTSQATVDVKFMDATGGEITTLTETICAGGVGNFHLPASGSLSSTEVGWISVTSDGPNVSSLVYLENQATDERVSYNAVVPGGEAIFVPLNSERFQGIMTEIALTNLNTSPGTTDVEIYLFDQNGFIDTLPRQLTAGEVQYINFDALTAINPGFLGSVVILPVGTTQPEIALAAVAVERIGRTLSDPDYPGDELTATEGQPLSLPAYPYPLGQCLEKLMETEPLRISLPALDTINCETWIQVQNTGNEPTKAILVLWGEPGACEPQAAGPIKAECSGLILGGGAWTWKGAMLPAGAKSGIIYSLGVGETLEGYDIAVDTVCEYIAETVLGDDDDWRRFDLAFRYGGSIGWTGGTVTFPDASGEPLAVTVDRICPGDNNPSVNVNAAYPGIDWTLEGTCNPEAGDYTYFAPLVWAGFGTQPDDLHSILVIQNTGDECTSVEIWFQAAGQCEQARIGTILALAPGEAWDFDPNTVVGPDFQGVARIRATQPLAVVVDHVGRDLFFSQPGMPADVPAVQYSAGSPTNVAPLFYREDQGWDTAVQVQNLSLFDDATVDVTFMDRTGNVITTLTEVICAGQSESFALPLSDVATASEVGWVQVDSDGPNVLSAVVLIKYADASGLNSFARTQPLEALSYNALPTSQVDGVGQIALPMAIGWGQGVLSEIALLNANSTPGTTDVRIDLYDENQAVGSLTRALSAGEVEYIDLDAEGVLPVGVIGSAVISATGGTQGGFALAAVDVERIGRTLTDPDIPGDEVKGYAGRALQWAFGSYPVEECSAATTPVLGLPDPLRINLPALEVEEGTTDIVVRNVGNEAVKAMLLVWGDPGYCEPQAVGPLARACSGLIPPEGEWSFASSELPSGARSGLIYALNDAFADDLCTRVWQTVLGDDDDWRRMDKAFAESGNWAGFDFGAHPGQPLEVVVERHLPDPSDPGSTVSMPYPGTPPQALGTPGEGCAFEYHIPTVYGEAGAQGTVLILQNAGLECTSISLWYIAEDETAPSVVEEILALAPGESWPVDVSETTGAPFKGSVTILSSQPLAFVVDRVPTIADVRVTNVRDTSLTVSWVTDQDAPGEVHYSTDPADLNQIAYDDRGADTSDDTHHVTLTSLLPETTYYFDVVSDGAIDDNEGAHYMVATGPTLSLPPSDTVYGQVFKEDGTTSAEGSIVYIALRDKDGNGSAGEAAPLSALVDGTGWWYANLGNARTADLNGYFDYSASGDEVWLHAQGAADGEGCRTVDTSDDTPAADIVLNVSPCIISWPMDIQLSWNHISLPLEPLTPYTAERVCIEINEQGGDTVEIDRWYASGWDGHICGVPFNDFDIELGSDYFIKAGAASIWTVEGYLVTEPVPLDLQIGWNSISVPHTNRYTAESLCQEIIDQGVAAIEIDRWYASGWDGHICGLPFNYFPIEIGKGYFVKAGSAGIVTPTLSATLWRQPESVPVARSEAAPEAVPPTAVTISGLRVSNLRDTSVTLSWITDGPATGYVVFGETPDMSHTAYDVRGPAVVDSTHYVVLTGLVPETTYTFDIVSGASVDDNGGAHYVLTTGAPLDSPPESDTVYGQVFRSDGATPAVGAIVYLTLMDSDGAGSTGQATLMSALVDEDGYWHANLGNARLADGVPNSVWPGAFAYSTAGDALTLVVQDAGVESVTQTVDTGDLRPAAPLKLDWRFQLYFPLIRK